MGAAPLFDAYVMVDWSAAASPATGANSLWWTCVERDGASRTANPATRAQGMAELTDLLSDLHARGLSVLAGFDFNFGFPAGFASRIDARDWKGVWQRLTAEMRDGADNANNRFALAGRLNQTISGGAAPFWGCPAGTASDNLSPTKPQPCGLPEKRLAENRVPSTKPVWQLFYNGSVGGQTLTGIPRLEELRRNPWLECRVWPFDTGLQPLTRNPGIVLAEVYPSLLGVRGDRAQVQALAAHFKAEDDAGRLAGAFAGDPTLTEDERCMVETEEGWILGVGPKMDIHSWIKDPAEIYRQSFATIRSEIDLNAIPADLRDLAVRVVHACGMTEIIADMAWSERAGAAGRAALGHGAPILVDAEMVAHGIIKARLPQANTVICTLNDPAIAGEAVAAGTTRSAQAVDHWLPLLDGAVVAIGNAPTALFRLLELIAAGAPKPALILGFPVGFVGAAESKEALLQSGLPFVTLRGRRGGSAMAAAAVNALAKDNEE